MIDKKAFIHQAAIHALSGVLASGQYGDSKSASDVAVMAANHLWTCLEQTSLEGARTGSPSAVAIKEKS